MRAPWLPVVDWTDAPTDLNGLVRFAERRNLVSARVPSHFKRGLHTITTAIETVSLGAAGWPCGVNKLEDVNQHDHLEDCTIWQHSTSVTSPSLHSWYPCPYVTSSTSPGSTMQLTQTHWVLFHPNSRFPKAHTFCKCCQALSVCPSSNSNMNISYRIGAQCFSLIIAPTCFGLSYCPSSGSK
jgi:hypothetical protein